MRSVRPLETTAYDFTRPVPSTLSILPLLLLPIILLLPICSARLDEASPSLLLERIGGGSVGI